jgi:cardiolipin synthase
MDGVDVRLLVPGASDVPWVSHMSRAGYRSLMEAGIRVFEWNGPMIHAKTAVADRRWARVGSTNLNLASWVGNYELDVAVEDMTVARQMADLYEGDLQRATEIVLDRRRRVRTAETAHPRPHRGKASAARAAAGALRLSNTVGAAITNRRVLGRNEASIMAGTGAVLLALAAIGIAWPVVLAAPIVLLAGWVGVALLIRALELYTRPRREEPRTTGSPRDGHQRS